MVLAHSACRWRGFRFYRSRPDPADRGHSYEPDTGFAASEIRASADFSVDGQDAEGALRSDRITETDILDGR